MRSKLLSLYSVKYNPFRPDVPAEALHTTPAIDTFLHRVVLGCVFRSTRPPIPPAPGQAFRSTRARSERSDGILLRPAPAWAHLSERGDAWMISLSLPCPSLRALSSS